MNTIGQNIYEGFEPLPMHVTGWNSVHDIFSDLILKVKPKVIIEVGTWKGASALTMAAVLKKESIDCKIYCVDTWLGSVEFWNEFKDTPERSLMLKNGYPSVYYQFLSNVVGAGLQDYIIPIPNTSANAAKILAYHGIKADLIYIDASHEYEDVFADIFDYRKLLNEGGVMFGDDYGWQGVKKAVDECFDVNGITNFPIDIVDNNYWIF